MNIFWFWMDWIHFASWRYVTIRISSWKYIQITVALSIDTCSMLVYSCNFVFCFVISVLLCGQPYSLFITDGLYSVGHWNPYRPYTGPENLAEPAFYCLNSEGKIFYTPENRTWDFKMYPWKIQIQTHHFLALKGEFCGDIKFFFPLTFLCLFCYMIPCLPTKAYGRCCLWTRRTQRSVTLRMDFDLGRSRKRTHRTGFFHGTTASFCW